jgi:hypothetical protein
VSLEAFNWVLNDAPDLPSHAFAVLVGLANHADPDGKGAFAAQGKLGGYARKTDRQVRRDLENLEFIGLIRRGDQRLAAHFPADKRPIVWDLAMDRRIEDRPVDVTDPEGVDGPVDNPKRPDVHVRADVHDRSSATGRQSPAGRGRPVADVRADVHDRSSTSDKPKSKSTTTTKPSPPPDGGAGQRDAKPPKINPLARFDDFWKIFPLKKGKPAAQKAFARAVAAGADPQAIIDGAIAYSLECRLKEPKYVKYPQGWLSDGRWQDESTPTAPHAPQPHNGASAYRSVAEVLAEQERYHATPEDDPLSAPADDPTYEPPF